MARPRFGPNAPRPSPGFTPVGTPPPPRVVPSGSTPRFGPASRPAPITNQQNLRGQFGPGLAGLDQSGLVDPDTVLTKRPGSGDQSILGRIAGRYERPVSTLGQIFRVLRLGENLSVGVVKGNIRGYTEAVSRAVKFDGKGFGGLGKDLLEALPAWAFVYAQGVGFKEMATAVKEDATYEEWIRESQDPNSFLYRHSMPIGIGLSIFGDPLTYVTFGTTGASKVAAQRLLAKSWASSHNEALEAIASGAAKGNLDRVWFDIHAANRRPFSLGDALADIRAGDRARMGIGEGRLGLNVAGNLRGVFARGGQGINFAGQQIARPGVTEKLGRKVPDLMSRQNLREAFSVFIPDAKLLSITDDARRFALMHEVQRVTAESARVSSKAVQESLKLFEVDSEAAQALQQAPSHIKRAEIAIRNMFGGRVPYVPQNDRKGLLLPGFTPEGPYANRLKQMQMTAKGRKTKLIEIAKENGFDDNMIKGIEDLWDNLIKTYDDPVQVVSEFSARVEGKLAQRRFVDQIVQNPMFARIPVDEVARELERATHDYSEISGRLFNARKALHQKGISQQAKASRTRAVRHWEQKHATAKATLETAKETHKLEVGKAGGRVVPSAEVWGQSIGESAVPLRWRGKTYAVPEPVAEAIEQIKNPQFIDTELKRAFRHMNWAQNKWKVLATSVNPAFHVMNLMGGMWNNLLGGVYNPGDYLETIADVYRYRAVASGRKGLLNRIAPLSDERMLDVSEQVAAFEALGAGGGLVKEELGQQMKNVLQPTTRKSGARRAFTAARRTYGVASLGAWIAPDEWVPDDIEEYLNPLIGAGLLLPEFMRAGSIAANDVEETLRMTPFRVAAKDKTYHQLVEAYSISPPSNFGKWMDDTDLGSIDMAKEVTWDIGAALAIRFQFDYSKLTWGERYIAKSIFPFYTFYKNNFVLQVVENAQRPRFLGAFDAVANYSESIADDDESNNPFFKELVPEYFDKLAMFQIPVPDFIREPLGLPQDQPLYLNPKLPFASLNLFPPLWQLANDDDMQPTGMKMMQMLSPVFGSIGPFAGGGPFKPMLEYSVGQQLGLARPIDYQRLQSGGWRNSYVEAPGYVKMLPGPLQDFFGVFKDPDTGQLRMNASLRYFTDQMASPFITGLGEPLSLASGEISERSASNTLSWMTGIRMTPVDPLRLQRGWLYRMENFLEGRRLELKERGLSPSSDDERFLRQIRSSIRSVERAWDDKQEELYGGG